MKAQLLSRKFFVLIGAVLALMCLLATGQGVYLAAGPSKVEYGPHPRDMVQIREGTAFTVPAGKLFVLTALGGRDYQCCNAWTLSVDGQVLIFAWPNYALNTVSFRPVPSGLTATAGDVIEVSGGQIGVNDGRAWGYLADPLPPGMDGQIIRVPYAPHPADMVELSEGMFFIVPNDKIFVLTALGSSQGGLIQLKVNAQAEVATHSDVIAPTGNPPHSLDVANVRPVPIGFAVPGGAIMEVVGGAQMSGMAFGYLADR